MNSGGPGFARTPHLGSASRLRLVGRGHLDGAIDDALPDLLDETLWNLRWILTMQDPNDGGVYHKCTTANFEGFVKPQNAT